MTSEEIRKKYFESDKDDVDFSQMKYLEIEDSPDKLVFHKKQEFNFKIFLQSVLLSIFLVGISFLCYHLITTEDITNEDTYIPVIVLSLFVFLLVIWIISLIFNGFTITVTAQGMHIKKIPFSRRMKFKDKSAIRAWRSRPKGKSYKYNFGYIHYPRGNGQMWLSRDEINYYLIFLFIGKTVKKKFGIEHSFDNHTRLSI